MLDKIAPEGDSMNDMKDVIEEIKNRCDIASIISQYIEIKPSGTNYKGLCPFHGEKTPSFYINTSKQIYKCFGCGEGGDVINFVMKIENLDFMDAVKLLAQKSGIEINTNIDEATKEKMEKAKKFQDIHVNAARFYFSNLISSKNPGYEYLRKRGLDDKIIKKFGLGYALDKWDSLVEYITSIGYTKQDLIECGLFGYKDETGRIYDKFRNRVIFPIFDYRGNVIGFGGRVLDDSLPKYLNSPDTIIFNKRHNLYGLNFARKEIKDRSVVLVEGYMDLISVYQYGVKNVVATLGTALTEQQGILIKRYVDTAIISYDSDEAGIKATLRAIEILTKLDINVKVLNLRDSKDPDEYIRKYGVIKYKEEMQDAIHYIKYKIDILIKDYNIQKDDEKIKFAKEATKIVKALKSPVEIDYYAKYLAKLLDISIDSIKREIYGKEYVKRESNNKFIKNKYENKSKQVTIEKPKVILKGRQFVEESLLKIMLEDVNSRNLGLSKVKEEDFYLNESKEILKWIIKNKELDKITIDKIKNSNISEEYIKDLESISLEKMDLYNVKNIDEIIKNVRKNTLNEKINTLLEEQKSIEKNNVNNVKEVDTKIMEIALNIVELRRKLQKM